MDTKSETAALRTAGVYSLLGVLVCVLAPHVERLPVWVSASVAALLAWRAWLAWRGCITMRAPREQEREAEKELAANA